MKKLLLLTIITVSFAGCATLFNEKRKTVSISSNPSGAEVWINNSRRGITPLLLELSNQKDHTILFRMRGRENGICELTTSVGIGWVILDIFGGLIPVVIDAATGSWKSLDSSNCNVSLLRRDSPNPPLIYQ